MSILIIDDSAADAELLSRLIEDQGHVARGVNSFDEAEVLNLSDFDLALIDLWMPGHDPDATIERARKMPMPFVCVTGDSNPELARKIGRAGLPLLNKDRMNFVEITHHALGLAEAAKERRDLLDEVKSLKIFREQPTG